MTFYLFSITHLNYFLSHPGSKHILWRILSHKSYLAVHPDFVLSIKLFVMLRRTFIKNSGLTVAAVAAGSSFAFDKKAVNPLPDWRGFNLLDFF